MPQTKGFRATDRFGKTAFLKAITILKRVQVFNNVTEIAQMKKQDALRCDRGASYAFALDFLPTKWYTVRAEENG